jgi:5-hydroxyisourate hydrolase
MSRITTHVLDTVIGKPAAGVRVHLDRKNGDQWIPVSSSTTNADGRCHVTENAGTASYRLTFQTGQYLSASGRKTIYPEISITFTCSGEEHYHLPLLLSDNSYTTYRGS